MRLADEQHPSVLAAQVVSYGPWSYPARTIIPESGPVVAAPGASNAIRVLDKASAALYVYLDLAQFVSGSFRRHPCCWHLDEWPLFLVAQGPCPSAGGQNLATLEIHNFLLHLPTRALGREDVVGRVRPHPDPISSVDITAL